MFKRVTCLVLLAGVLCTWPLATGCHHKKVTYERSERIEQTEPEMVSPGHEKQE